jgi:FkbM family methyltransferase
MELIFDVGVCDGADSAYYLTQARRVVGVEANPLACQALRERFATEIAEGRYVLEQVGVADEAGELTFWVCDDNPHWSSFRREIASRKGSRHHEVKVPTVRFETLVRRHGVPDYCKIDIEGHDVLCLRHLEPEIAPAYISVEMDHGDELIAEMVRLHYQGFKVISQRTLSPASPGLASVVYPLPERIKSLVRRADQKFRGRRYDGAWTFPFGASGTFAEKTPGRWMGADPALRVCARLRAWIGATMPRAWRIGSTSTPAAATDPQTPPRVPHDIGRRARRSQGAALPPPQSGAHSGRQEQTTPCISPDYAIPPWRGPRPYWPCAFWRRWRSTPPTTPGWRWTGARRI